MNRMLFSTALAVTVAAAPLMGYGVEKDPISQAEKGEKHRPGITETKAIAEEGYAVSA